MPQRNIPGSPSPHSRQLHHEHAPVVQSATWAQQQQLALLLLQHRHQVRVLRVLRALRVLRRVRLLRVLHWKGLKNAEQRECWERVMAKEGEEGMEEEGMKEEEGRRWKGMEEGMEVRPRQVMHSLTSWCQGPVHIPQTQRSLSRTWGI